MTSPDFQKEKEIRYFVSLMLEGQMDERDFSVFQQLLQHDDQAQEYYLDLLDINVSLRKLDWTLENLELRGSDTLDREMWSALSYAENHAPAIQLAKPEPIKHVVVEKLEVPKGQRQISHLSVAALILSSAAMLLMLAYVYFNPQVNSQPVAVVTDSLEAVWGNGSLALEPGDSISSGDQTRFLLSGLVKVESLLGPELIIEGPSLFQFPDQNKMVLQSGRVHVKVPKNAIGYTVRTPSFSVIDLGTEFGVGVENDGSGRVYMFSGKASLVAGTQGQTNSSHILTEGTAKRVYAIDNQVEDIPFADAVFVRRMDSRQGLIWKGESVNLADIVGGGNGFGTGKIGVGINPLNGQMEQCLTPEEATTPGQGFVETSRNRFVDGVFVPDGSAGPVQVSSKGHFFAQCPPTTNLFWTPVLNGGQVAQWFGAEPTPMFLDGVEYGTASNPAIFVHSNLGVTFDLNAIRSVLDAAELDAFRAKCGISSSGPNRSPWVDIWILVDGQLRFVQKGVGASKVYDISVPLRPGDEFLTLMTTDGGDQICLESNEARYPIDSDWCMFAEPRLMLRTD